MHGVDKFPRMIDYVVPSGVRIADADRVRLGAHLASGTTVMHEGFVNFNAGTLGTSMVEGRISAGVVVGDGSDVGGGASIMGTLSGGGTEVVTIGERCLIGANAGVGISLGDDCVVEAGCYVTAGSKITLPDGDGRHAAASSPARTACSSGATRSPARSRPASAPAPGAPSTSTSTPTTDPHPHRRVRPPQEALRPVTRGCRATRSGRPRYRPGMSTTSDAGGATGVVMGAFQSVYRATSRPSRTMSSGR